MAKENVKRVDENIWCFTQVGGGPVMKIVLVEGDNAMVCWEGSDGKFKKALMPINCIRKLVPTTTEELRKYAVNK